MTAWDDLLQRVTRPLRMDPELRREIAQELRSHLDDAKAQHQAGGKNEEEAEAAAIRDLGKEDELSQQLWQANRRRIRVRKTVKYAAGVTLLPATAVLSVSMAWGALVSIAVLIATATSGTHMASSLSRPLAERFNRKMLADIPADAKAVLASRFESPAQRLASARSLAQAHPADPLYYANYAGQCLQDVFVPNVRLQTIDRAKVKDVLAVLDHGKQVEPDNGLYPLLKAGLLFEVSTTRLPYKERSPLSFEYRSSIGTVEHLPILDYRVNDRALFEQAMIELHEAAKKPKIDSHSFELTERTLLSLPPPRTLSDEVWRRERRAENVPQFSRLYYIIPALWQATESVEQGNLERASEILHDCDRVAIAIARGTDRKDELIIARNLFRLSLGEHAIIYRKAGNQARFDRTLATLRADQARVNEIISAEEAQRHGRGISDDAIALADFRYLATVSQFDPAPARRAEYAVADRLALAILLSIFTLLGVGTGIGSVLFRIRNRRWPGIVFVGWKNLATIVLTSTLLPVALYAAYAACPWSGRDRPADLSSQRLSIEYAVVACTILALLRTLSDRALLKRSLELGAREIYRPPPRRWTLALGVALTPVTLVFIAVTRGGGSLTGMAWLFPALAAGVIAYMLMWIVASENGQGAETNAVKRRRPAVIWLLITAWLVVAGKILFSSSASQSIEAVIRGMGVAIFAVVAVVVVARWVRRIRRPEAMLARESFDYRLSTAPMFLLSALVLALALGLPLKWAERRAVSGMEGSAQTHSPSHELDQSPYRALKDWMLAQHES